LILVLGYFLAVRQRREARLRAALALYKSRATGEIADLMGRWIPLDWPQDTPLGEAIEHIKAGTKAGTAFTWGFPKGLPILVDPEGLREAGASLSSPVATPPDDSSSTQFSLRQKLRIILEPLGLAYQVKGGAIVITSRSRAVAQSDAADDEE
jgi:hypothetical protein